MSYKSRAQVMRDRDDLEEQRWQPASSGSTLGNDPLAELARIVGQGAAVPPAGQDTAAPRGGAPAGQQDWMNEIERAFGHGAPGRGQPQGAQPPASTQYPAQDVAQGVPEWLRSPAVPQGAQQAEAQPQYSEEALQEFSRSLDEASLGPQADYYAQDPYRLAAAGSAGFAASADAHAPAHPGYGSQAGYDPQVAGGAAQDAGYQGGGYDAYGYAGDGYAADGGYAEDEAPYDDRPARRRKVIIAAAALGVGALVVAGLFLSGGGETVNGEPPVFSADSEPVKVEPETPGGAEVPNTNRAIYEHTNQAPTGEGAVVVDDREQPVDINQMIAQQNAAAEARAIQDRAAGVQTETTTAPNVDAADVVLPEAPEPTSPAIAALGEPRRVRTVSVRPDGSILPSNGAPQAPVAPTAPTIEQLASGTTPSVSSPATTPVDEPQAPAVTPNVAPVPRPAAVNRPATRAPMQLGPMALTPSSGAQVAQAPAAPQAAAPAASGAFTVQLAAPGSENEARTLFANLQRRYGDLAGYSPNIIRAESGGRTIYRLRVGAFPSRDAATALCVRIQAAGGQCFVARN
ncbi:SPOR domain-containing protein [Pseudochelatococcus contaminans]|nr:SPOR domain-containing protein [Pseudochelatococcus contaminans]